MTRLLRRFVFETARLYHVYSRIAVCLVVILRRGRYVEAAKTSEHRPFCWSHNESFANSLRVDVEWNSDRVHREKSGGG